MDRRRPVQLAEDPLQVVAAVAVEQDALADPVGGQRVDQVGDHPGDGRRVEVHRQGEPHLVGLGPVGQRRQQHDPGPPLVGPRAGALGDHLDLEGVGAVGQVEVVRLGRPQGQDGHLERRAAT